MRKRGIWCRPVSVYPSVCLVDCIQVAEDIVKRFLRPGSRIILVSWPNSEENPFSGGAKYTGLENLQFLTEIAVYLGNGTR